MFTRARSITVIATMLLLALATQGAAQITLPTRPHETLSLELESLRDDITLYKGDPQHLLLMSVNPDRFRPRVEYSGAARALLRIRDLYLFENPKYSSLTPEEREKAEGPIPEEWEIRLCPSGPTSFTLQCDRGKGTFDFSEFQVQSVHIEANRTKVEVEFASQNPIVLESFFASVPAGSLRFQHLLNARAKQVTLDVPGAVCQLEVVGAESEGESVINLQSVPSEMKVVVSRKVGVRVTGPPATAAHFAAPHMAQAGEDWTSQGYEAAKCRVRFTFAEDVPKLEVAWK